jgi:acyl-CoA thioesterase-1
MTASLIFNSAFAHTFRVRQFAALGRLGREHASRPPGYRRGLASWLAVVILAGIGAIPTASGASQPTLLVYGDSISAAYGIQRADGWVEKLAVRLTDTHPDWQVVNASVSGETTSGGLARLPSTLATHSPAIVVLELGGNDALRGYPLERIRGNLDRMVTLARDAGSAVLLVGMQIPPNYGQPYVEGFAALFRDVAGAQDVPLVPFLLEGVALAPGLMQDDGIHPTAAAQPLMLETIWPVLEPLLARQGSAAR